MEKVLTLKSIDSTRGEMITRCSRERDDEWVTALDSGGAAKIRAIVGVDTLRGDVSGEEE